MQLIGKPSGLFVLFTLTCLLTSAALIQRDITLSRGPMNLKQAIEWMVKANFVEGAALDDVVKKYIPLGTSRDNVIDTLQQAGFSFTPHVPNISDADFARLDAAWRKEDWLHTYADISAYNDRIRPPYCLLCFNRPAHIKLHFDQQRLAALETKVDVQVAP